MKPLEPGCLAIVTRSENKENIGKTVVCIQHLSIEEPLKVNFIAQGVRSNLAGQTARAVWLVNGPVNIEVIVGREGDRALTGVMVDCAVLRGGATGNGLFSSEELMRIDGFDSDLTVYEKDRDLFNIWEKVDII